MSVTVRFMAHLYMFAVGKESRHYNERMERKVFWICFTVLGLAADFVLPLWWALAATIPAAYVSWWVAYRSDWF
jgi:hypothetical protein